MNKNETGIRGIAFSLPYQIKSPVFADNPKKVANSSAIAGNLNRLWTEKAKLLSKN
jgi:hypothetical protein